MRWIGLLLGALAMGAGAYFARLELFDHRSAASSMTDVAQPGDLSSVRRIFAGGTVEGTQRDVPLRFEIAGRLKEINVKEGDHVERGDVLAQLNPEVWELKLAEAQARLKLARAERDRLVNGASPESREVLKSEVRAAEVQVREAEALLARGKQLAQRKAISLQELDDQQYKYEKAAAHLRSVRARSEEIEAPVRQDDLGVAEAKVALAEALVHEEKNMLEKTRLRAPSTGVVLHVLAEPGELVGPGDDRDLFTLVNRDSTRVRAYVEELDALSVAFGQKAFVTADGKPGRKYEGTVLSCSPYVRPKTHKHQKPGEMIDLRVREVVIELAHGDDLVIGLPVDVFIQRGSQAGERVSALLHRQEVGP